MTAETPLLSVVIVTYNHENFIAKAIEGVLAQKVNFDYEILICDDASTDSTREILNSFQNKHPNDIELLLNDTNAGPLESASQVYKKCRGKYITWLDGDDYWSYEEKLQKQLDFLEENIEYVGCFHDAQIVTLHEKSENKIAKEQLLEDCDNYSQFNEYRSDFYPWHLLQRNIIPTASLVFRNNENLNLFEEPPSTSLSLNWLLHLRIIKSSKFKYFHSVWTVYNDHPKGVSKTTPINAFKKANIAILNNLLTDEYYWEFKSGIYQSMANEYLQILLNPNTIKESKKEYYKASMNYLISCFKTIVHLRKYYRQMK